jgi:hypothetical protein
MRDYLLETLLLESFDDVLILIFLFSCNESLIELYLLLSAPVRDTFLSSGTIEDATRPWEIELSYVWWWLLVCLDFTPCFSDNGLGFTYLIESFLIMLLISSSINKMLKFESNITNLVWVEMIR